MGHTEGEEKGEKADGLEKGRWISAGVWGGREGSTGKGRGDAGEIKVGLTATGHVAGRGGASSKIVTGYIGK